MTSQMGVIGFNHIFQKMRGKTWKWKIPIEHVEPGKGSFSYPSFIQTPDGMLRMTYSSHVGTDQKSIKYVVLDPSKIN